MLSIDDLKMVPTQAEKTTLLVILRWKHGRDSQVGAVQTTGCGALNRAPVRLREERSRTVRAEPVHATGGEGRCDGGHFTHTGLNATALTKIVGPDIFNRAQLCTIGACAMRICPAHVRF